MQSAFSNKTKFCFTGKRANDKKNTPPPCQGLGIPSSCNTLTSVQPIPALQNSAAEAGAGEDNTPSLEVSHPFQTCCYQELKLYILPHSHIQPGPQPAQRGLPGGDGATDLPY